MNLTTLHELIAAVCPIDGINSGGVIWFAASATPEQQVAAQGVMNTNLPQLGVIEPPPPLTPLEQIRAIEATPTVADAAVRAARITALTVALDKVIKVAADNGQTVTQAQAHVWAMANDADYSTLFTAEQAIKPLRAQV